MRRVVVSVETHAPLEFADITDALSRAVNEVGLVEGLLVVQTRHTTTGLLINEHEPLLLADLEALFERLAPVGGRLRARRLQSPHREHRCRANGGTARRIVARRC